MLVVMKSGMDKDRVAALSPRDEVRAKIKTVANAAIGLCANE